MTKSWEKKYKDNDKEKRNWHDIRRDKYIENNYDGGSDDDSDDDGDFGRETARIRDNSDAFERKK